MDALGIHPGFLISQVVNFLLLFALLHTVLYKRIFKMLDERKQKIKESLEEADRVRQESARDEAAFSIW